jgi:predicted oxidoreductase
MENNMSEKLASAFNRWKEYMPKEGQNLYAAFEAGWKFREQSIGMQARGTRSSSSVGWDANGSPMTIEVE